MKPKFRVARDSDARDIARIHLRSWRDAYEGLLPATYLSRLQLRSLEREWARRISRAHVRSGVWVLEHDARVVGFSKLGPCTDEQSLVGFAGEVSMLYLAPEHVGIGFGKILLSRSMEVLERRGYYWLVIWVLARNGEARRFYEHMRLRPDGARRTDRFDGRSVSVVRYARAINGADLTLLLAQTPAR